MVTTQSNYPEGGGSRALDLGQHLLDHLAHPGAELVVVDHQIIRLAGLSPDRHESGIGLTGRDGILGRVR